jgi:hypothetical protein
MWQKARRSRSSALEQSLLSRPLIEDSVGVDINVHLDLDASSALLPLPEQALMHAALSAPVVPAAVTVAVPSPSPSIPLLLLEYNTIIRNEIIRLLPRERPKRMSSSFSILMPSCLAAALFPEKVILATPSEIHDYFGLLLSRENTPGNPDTSVTQVDPPVTISPGSSKVSVKFSYLAFVSSSKIQLWP